jgi:predicted Zn-dependent protease
MRDALAPESRRVDDPALDAVIDRIVTRLDAHAPEHPYTFRVTIVRSDEVNALAAPGGELVFYTGLIAKTRSPEELAGVMAHEMQHVLQRHSTKAILRRMSTGALLAFFVGDAGALTGVVDAARELGDLAYGRSDELEADREGLELLRSAGIDPRAMVTMFETLAANEPNTPRAFRYLSTHPGTAERIRRMSEKLDRPITIEPIPTPEDWAGLVTRVAGGS